MLVPRYFVAMAGRPDEPTAIRQDTTSCPAATGTPAGRPTGPFVASGTSGLSCARTWSHSRARAAAAGPVVGGAVVDVGSADSGAVFFGAGPLEITRSATETTPR